MRIMKFGELEIEVIDIADVSVGERVIEFVYRTDQAKGSFAAVVVPDGGSWASALLSISPRAGDISAPLMVALMEFAREMIDRNKH